MRVSNATAIRSRGVKQSSLAPLVPGSGVAVLMSVPIEPSTDNAFEITWNAFDGTLTNRVLGTQFVQVLRGASGVPVIPPGGNTVGADFDDTTAGLVLPFGPWQPTCALNGNDLEVRITADPNNSVVPDVLLTVKSKSTIGAPAPADPILVARAVLLSTGFAGLQLDAYLGLAPANPVAGTPITSWADQGVGANNATKAGANNILFERDGSNRPYLLYPATGAQFVIGGLGASHTQTFAFVLELGVAPGANIQTVLCDFLTGHYIAIDFSDGGIYFNDGTTAKRIGTAVAGKHRYVIVADAVNATLYIDTVASAPVAIVTATNEWNVALGIGGRDTLPATYPLISAKMSCLYEQQDALNRAARIAAFEIYGLEAFGP
jgi:hypothetical protein